MKHAAILAANGFVEVRRRGSHIIMQRQHAGTTTTVPVPDHRQLKLGTLASIIHQNCIARAAFES
ncbi:MAG: type II toxin-antitoxin system HicA family toxin [Pseudomonadota bacterium]